MHGTLLSRVAVVIALPGMVGCAHHSGLTMRSSEWDPQLRARNDAVEARGATANSAKPVAASDVTPIKTSSSTQEGRQWTLDPLYILSFPVFLIWDGLKHVVLTDTDPSSRPKFETSVFFAPESAAIGDEETFEVQVKYMAIDYFTGGRLRDAWGGQGGQVSVQASLNALSDAGMLLGDDTTFVVENEVKRRSPLLAIAKGTTKGREFVEKLTDHAKTVLENAKELELVADKIDEYVKKIQAETKDRAKLLETLRTSAHAKIEDWVGKNVHGTDEAALVKQVGDSVVDAIFDDIARRLDDHDVDQAAAWIARVTQAAKRHLDQATAVLGYFDRYGVDEGGIYESAKIIVGLADADRRTTIDFENVKPSLVQFPGEASGGTAATLIGDDINATGELVLANSAGTDAFRAAARDKHVDRGAEKSPKSTADSANPVVSSRGLVYRGTLRELSRSMDDVKGVSLSFLMIDRGDDRVVRALRTLQQYTDQSGITVGGGGAQIPLSAIVDGLSTLAERISEDKVELRSIDVRFMSGTPRKGATPGRELFALRPCTLLISRNLAGKKFGAVAEITVARVQ